MSDPRPPYIIEPDDVNAWLADSAVRVVTYHNTDRRIALVEEVVRIVVDQ